MRARPQDESQDPKYRRKFGKFVVYAYFSWDVAQQFCLQKPPLGHFGSKAGLKLDFYFYTFG
ncbi:hypothetical protein BC936DRAFT_144088 [Jimgerdemannia flammicorona]|uniref:Uncharacterized protein n=1 Tax=Jimgerdemannia flammicorona TaxID=994334 RepID=A0A433DD37_9FUNG|nr:hypothetical protein BC936DRAFT_144088 [Jimgerdemannia flammicorona]